MLWRLAGVDEETSPGIVAETFAKRGERAAAQIVRVYFCGEKWTR
jgi:hypothetical protein